MASSTKKTFTLIKKRIKTTEGRRPIFKLLKGHKGKKLDIRHRYPVIDLFLERTLGDDRYMYKEYRQHGNLAFTYAPVHKIYPNKKGFLKKFSDPCSFIFIETTEQHTELILDGSIRVGFEKISDDWYYVDLRKNTSFVPVWVMI